MTERMEALAMHDALLLNAPVGAEHASELCPFCLDWAMTEDGTPSGRLNNDYADASKPYGDIKYADPGLLADGISRFPIDNEAHAAAAWSFIHQATVAENYNADQLASIRTAITAAMKQFGVDAEEKEVEKTKKLADAKSGSPEPKKTSPDSTASSADSQPEVASEGGTSPMETITQETHNALLEKALRDATASLEAEKANLLDEVSSLKEAATAATEEVANLKSENERLNGDLDTAQVAVKAAEDEAAALKADVAAKEEAAVKAELASERAGQVRNLGLFGEDYIGDKASRWADMDEAAWTERLDEWKAARGTSTPAPQTTDTASAVTGSSESGAGAKGVTARRAALGLN